MWWWPIEVVTPATPCEPLPLSQWRTMFPEFNDISDARVSMAMEEASCWVDSTWLQNHCANCTIAMSYLAAHFLAQQLMAASTLPEVVPDDGSGTGGQVIAGGQLTSLRFESMGVSFSAPKWAAGAGGAGSGSGVGDTFDLSSTPWGQRYLEYLKVNKPAVMVV